MKRIITSLSMLAVALVAASSLGGCEDAAPTEYMPQPVVEAFLIVGEPIRDIRVTLSQSVTDTFRYRNSAVANADVKLISGDRTLQLQYRENDRVGEYHYPDTTVLVEPSTRYKLVVTMPDGAVASGETTTPIQIAWINAPKTPMRYPLDTAALPRPADSLALSWTPAPSVVEYIISVRCVDTLGYGIYLDTPTSEKNRRIQRFWEENAPFYDDVARLGFLQEPRTPVSWFAFKWFGRQEVTVFASDAAFVNWYKMTHFQNPPSFEPLLGNVTGGIGVVASASVARKEILLLKNQP